MHSVDQRPNLRHLCEPLGGTEDPTDTEAVGEDDDEEQARMSAGSEFQTEGAATLKPREANTVWTRGTNDRLVLEEHRRI